MGFWGNLLFGEPKHKTLIVNIPYQLVFGAETLIYLQNNLAKHKAEEIDMDYIVGSALHDYLHKYLGERTKDKVKDIDGKPYMDRDILINGRRQSMSDSDK
jgi:hypothetical protein